MHGVGLTPHEFAEQFADQRAVIGVKHLANTLSCLPLLIASAVGLAHTLAVGPSPTGYCTKASDRWVLSALFTILVVAAFGWSYFHLVPGPERHVYDWAPTIGAWLLVLPAAVASRRYDRRADWVAAGSFLAAAAVAGWFDHAVFDAGGIVSGHTVEHLLIGVSVAILVRGITRRRPLA